MTKALKAFIIVIYLCCAGLNSHAQQSTASATTPGLLTLQDSLIRLSRNIVDATENTTRFEHNAIFIKTLVQALRQPNSFDFPFDSLDMVSVIKSPDNAVKLYTWFVPTNEGSFRYFGTIQMPSKDGTLRLIPLIDQTENFPDSNAVSDPKTWFGSRYYDIVPVNTGKDSYYALLGWKGNNQKTTSKVIEILSFKNGTALFGKAVFEQGGKLSTKNRLVFTYNKMNSMTLRYDRKVNMIVCDHLAPYDPAMKDNFEFYASDSSFNGYQITKGRLKLVENIELNNDPDDQDALYMDPARTDIPVKKKF
jgi:hypothetical protein